MARYFLYLFIVILAFIFIGRQFFRLPLQKASVFEAVPVTVPLFITLPETASLSPPDTLVPTWQSWMNMLPGVGEDLQLIEGLLDSDSLAVASGKMVLMIQKLERQNWSLSLVADIGRGQKKLEQYLAKNTEAKIEETRFRGRSVYQIEPTGAAAFSVGAYRNLLIVGRLPVAVEDVIRQLSDYRSSLWQDEAFQVLAKRSTRSETASLFLQSGLFSDFFRHQMPNDGFARLQEMEAAFRWVQLDINSLKEQVKLGGLLLPAQDDKKVRAFREQEAQKPGAIFQLIPQDIAMLYYWGYSDFQKYYEAIDAPLIDRFERFVKPWVGRELVQVVVDPAAASSCVLIKTSDPVMAKNSLDRLLGEAGQLQAYQYNTFQVQQVLEEDLFGFLPFGPVTALRNPHITFLNDYVLFAPTQSAMEIWLDHYVLGNTLAGDPDFLEFQKVNEGAFHHLLYFNAKHWPRGEKVLALNPFLKRFPFFGMGLKGHEEAFSLEMNWSPARQPDTLGNLVWRANLSTDAILAPELVSLGKTGRQVVVTQDAFYNFYVFEAGGGLLWQKKLEGRVHSPVHAFDYYSDGDFQLLFNTPGNIYLINAEGEAMPNFPIPLRIQASTGLTLVDFKQDNNPAFFVPGENGQVYGYDRKGQPLVGWNPLFDAGHLQHPLLHFQKGVNDYLVALSDTARIKVYGKDGTLRFEVTDSTSVFHSPPGFQLSEQQDRIVAVDEKGIAHVLNLDGKYFRLALRVGQNESVRFAFADVVGNSNKDYIALSGQALAIYHYAEKGFVRALNHQFAYPQDSIFAVAHIGQPKVLIGALNKARRQVHLVDENGNSLPGFPIAGTSAFSIVDLYQDGRPVVLGANGAAIYGIVLR